MHDYGARFHPKEEQLDLLTSSSNMKKRERLLTQGGKWWWKALVFFVGMSSLFACMTWHVHERLKLVEEACQLKKSAALVHPHHHRHHDKQEEWLDDQSFLAKTPAMRQERSVEFEPTSQPTIKVLVVHDNTTFPGLLEMVSHIKRGCEDAAAQQRNGRKAKMMIQTLNVDQATFTHVKWADAIILGTMVFNMNVNPQMQTWINSWDFRSDLSEKIGAAFVTAGGISAGEELVMTSLHHSMMIFQMIIVGGNDWTAALGASAITEEDPFVELHPTSREPHPSSTNESSTFQDRWHRHFLSKAYGLGRRVTRVTRKFIDHSY